MPFLLRKKRKKLRESLKGCLVLLEHVYTCKGINQYIYTMCVYSS